MERDINQDRDVDTVDEGGDSNKNPNVVIDIENDSHTVAPVNPDDSDIFHQADENPEVASSVAVHQGSMVNGGDEDAQGLGHRKRTFFNGYLMERYILDHEPLDFIRLGVPTPNKRQRLGRKNLLYLP